MNIDYRDLIDKTVGVCMEGHQQADWSRVQIGDTVLIPDLFSFRVVFKEAIEGNIKKRAAELGAYVREWTSVFAKGEVPGTLNVTFVANQDPGGSRPNMQPHRAPHHRGNYYGPEENIFPLLGWNIISIPSQYEQDEFLTPFDTGNRKHQKPFDK